MNITLDIAIDAKMQYRRLTASKVCGNEYIEADLLAAKAECGYTDIEHAEHIYTAGGLRNVIGWIDRITACKLAVPQLVADVRAIESRHAETDPTSRREREARHDELTAAKQKLNEARQEISDGNGFYWTISHIVDEEFMAEAYRVGSDIAALETQVEKIRDAIKPELKRQAVHVEAEGTALGYTTWKNVVLDEDYWEREAMYADSEQAKQAAKKKHLAIMSGKGKLSEIQSQIATLRNMHDELSRRPLEVYMFKM